MLQRDGEPKEAPPGSRVLSAVSPVKPAALAPHLGSCGASVMRRTACTEPAAAPVLMDSGWSLLNFEAQVVHG